MKTTTRYLLLILLMATIAGCGTSRKQVLASGSQVEVRSYQTRTYDTNDKIRVLRAVMGTLQDLGFVIEKADDVVGIVSATKLQGYALSMSISVRPNGQQMTVRANAQYNLTAVEDPGPYQDFFTSLDKGLFLDDNLYAGSVPTQTPAEDSSTGASSREATDVFAYYGEAEQEITDSTYDKDLWARAYVEVQGDEQKRMAKYIELRAMELYAADAMSLSTSRKKIRPVETSQATLNQKAAAPDTPDALDDISGTYVSKITKSGFYQKLYFQEDRYRRLLITLNQTNNIITGTDSFGTATIEGTRTGDVVKFTYWSPNARIANNQTLHGKWKIKPGSSTLDGSWSDGSTDGSWNLSKVDAGISGKYRSDTSGTYRSDISGTYRSDISGSGAWSLGESPNIEVKLKQNKGEISGTFSGTRSGEIEGALNGNTIKFKWFVTAGRTESGRGEWKLPNDGLNWNGTWRSSRGSQGNWNLTKIE